MSASVSTPPTDDPQVAGTETTPAPLPRSVQRDRDGGNSKLGTFGVSGISHHCDPQNI